MGSDTQARPRWIAQNLWCGVDLTSLHPDWVGERCKRPAGHLGIHNPVLGEQYPQGELWYQVQREPVEYVHDPDRVNHLLMRMERELIWEMWSKGWSAVTPPYWEMWVERGIYGRDHDDWLRGDWAEAHFKVTVVGVPIR